MNGYVYNIMKRTRHQYHYAIRCAKRNNTEIIRTKLADNMSNSNDFWKELQKIYPASKSISITVDQAVGPEQITNKSLTKYEELFNTQEVHSPLNSFGYWTLNKYYYYYY